MRPNLRLIRRFTAFFLLFNIETPPTCEAVDKKILTTGELFTYE